MEIEVFGVNDGHTERGIGSGAVGFISESEFTRKIGSKVREGLRARGQGVINCTIDRANSVQESLDLIVQQANREELDWFISIHLNAGKGRGVEAYTYEGRQFQDALDVCNNIADLGFVNRGVKAGTGLYVIRKTKAKSMLIEVCFVDSADAQQLLSVGVDAIANAIVDGLLGKEVATAPQEKYDITYDTHIENVGWQGTRVNGETAGTVGQSRRLEAITINYNGPGTLEFQTHLAFLGWQVPRNSGEVAGTIGQSRRIEAIKINLRDTDKSVKYRVHIEGIGWQEWKKNGEVAGTVGESKRLEAIEIKVE